MTYQKTLVNEKEINQIINNAYKLLHNNFRENYKINLYFKYQKSMKAMIHKEFYALLSYCY